MKVLLIGPDLEENLSLGYLASSLEQAGHEADLQSYNGEKDIDGILRKLPEADIAGLSLTYQAKAKEYLHLATVIKEHAPDISIIAGGHYATCAARDILIHHPEIDIIVLHEGEETIVELAELYEHQNRGLASVAGIAYRQDDDVLVTSPRHKIEDLDSLPFPKRNNKAYILAGVPTAYLLGSRGCLNSCTYCCISTIHKYAPGKRFRQRKPEQIAREMAELYYQRGVRHFVFHDDNFLVSRLDQNLSRLEELEKEIHRNNLKDIGLTIKCCPSDVEESLFAKLKEMGLVRVFLGIESSCNKIVYKLKRRQTLEQSENAIAICRALGISVQFNIMVFNPFADFNSIRDDIAFMEKYIDHPLNFCRTELFAGTPLEKEMIEQKRARGNYLARVYSMATPAVDRASRFFTRLFYDRCWSQSSLMLMSGGMDHLSAVLNQHYNEIEARFLRNRIRGYVIRVNEDSIALLKEMIALFKNEAEFSKSELVERLRTLAKRERCSRDDLLQLGENIREDLSHFVHTRLGIEPADGIGYEIKRKRSNLAKHAMAVVLALSVSGASSCISFLGGGVEEYAPPPLAVEDTDGDGLYDEYEWNVFRTSPDLVDTDNDGIPDGEEDHDGDGITNWEYQVNEETPIIGAIQQRNFEKAMVMIELGDDPNAKDARGGTALMAAAEIGNTRIVEVLLDVGVDVNARNNDGWTALMAASRGGYYEIAELLLLNRADANAKMTGGEFYGWTALMFAEKKGHIEIVQMLKKAGVKK